MARRAHDAYFTPRWATAALLLHAPDLGGALYDPCCGDGRMALQLQEAGVVGELYLNDIDPAAGRLLGLLDRAEMTALDATRDEAWKAPAIDLVISNPPFMAAGSIARQALRHARVAVALLLRIT